MNAPFLVPTGAGSDPSSLPPRRDRESLTRSAGRRADRSGTGGVGGRPGRGPRREVNRGRGGVGRGTLGSPEMDTILDILDGAVARGADRPVMRIVRDDGTDEAWSFRDLGLRSRCAAWRLRALGLAARRPAAHLVALGARAAGGLLRGDAGRRRPRPARPADGGRCDRADRRTGRGAPPGAGDRPRCAGPARGPASTVCRRRPSTSSRPRPTPRSRPTGRHSSPPGRARRRDDLFELVFTSGTTGNPKGVMLTHGNVLATIAAIHKVIPPLEHRLVSILPLSHLLEQVVGLFYARRGPGRHPLRPQPQPAGHLRGHPRPPHDVDDPRAPGPRPVLVVDRARGREVGPDAHVRPPPVGRPAPALSGPPAHLPARPRRLRWWPAPPRLDRGVPAPGPAAGLGGPRGRRHPGLRLDRVRLRHVHDPRGPRARDGRPVRAAGRGAARRRRRDPRSRPERLPRLLARRGGDRGRALRRRLVPDRRHRPLRRRTGGSSSWAATRTSSCCPTASTCIPRTSRTPCAWPGIRDSVVVETRPGRIEAIVLAPGSHGLPQGGDIPAARAGRRRGPGARARAHRREHQGGQPDPRRAPAGRRPGASGPTPTSRGPTPSR